MKLKGKWIPGHELWEEWGMIPWELYKIVMDSIEKTDDPEKLQNRPDWIKNTYDSKEEKPNSPPCKTKVLNVGLQAYTEHEDPIDQITYLSGRPDNPQWGVQKFYIGGVYFKREEAEKYFEKLINEQEEESGFQLPPEFYASEFPKKIESQKESIRAYLMKFHEKFKINDVADKLGKSKNFELSSIHREIRMGRKTLIDILCRDKKALALLRQGLKNI